ncbi:hypothetical protein [Streptomyces longispororuber]|uniref:hypothetical protein n=1 Tax=Streptomyces longispororuber TaxID=68230 RepID=UPI0036FBA949
MRPEILARIATARAARDLSDLARQAVATAAQPATTAERIEQARRLRNLAGDIVDLVVLTEALEGTSWEEITKALKRRDPGTVEDEYADEVAQWQALPEHDMAQAAAGLDAWYARHREDHDPAADNPLKGLLNQR